MGNIQRWMSMGERAAYNGVPRCLCPFSPKYKSVAVKHWIAGYERGLLVLEQLDDAEHAERVSFLPVFFDDCGIQLFDMYFDSMWHGSRSTLDQCRSYAAWLIGSLSESKT